MKLFKNNYIRAGSVILVIGIVVFLYLYCIKTESIDQVQLSMPGHNAATIPHELMHAMGLAHTFTNNNADAAAQYTDSLP